MVTEYGFDEELWAQNFVDERAEGNYLGIETTQKLVSPHTQEIIDKKVTQLLKDAFEKARGIILSHKELHEKIAKVLLEKEEMIEEEFDAFFIDVPNVPVKEKSMI
jgi:cell division protease FtsH